MGGPSAERTTAVFDLWDFMADASTDAKNRKLIELSPAECLQIYTRDLSSQMWQSNTYRDLIIT